jgi:hypothetical protein
MISFMHRPLYPRQRIPGTHCMGGWVGFIFGLDAVKKRKYHAPNGNRNPIPASSSQSTFVIPIELLRLLNYVG